MESNQDLRLIRALCRHRYTIPPQSLQVESDHHFNLTKIAYYHYTMEAYTLYILMEHIPQLQLPQVCLECPYLKTLREALLNYELELTKENLLELLNKLEAQIPNSSALASQ